MIILSGASDVLRLVTSTTAPIDTVVSYGGLVGAAVTPGQQRQAITTVATTTILSSPGSGNFRSIRGMTVRNKSATVANTVTLQAFDGTTAFEIFSMSLAALECLTYEEGLGYMIFGANGLPRTAQSAFASQPAVNALNIVVLSADVINNNAVANTLQDVTGLSFPVVATGKYWFRFTCDFDAALGTTGSRWTINGPAATRMVYRSDVPSGSATITFTTSNSYQGPSAATVASAATIGNIAVVEGIITPSVDGTVQLQFASEIASSAITAKAGSLLQWVRTV